MGPTAQVGLWGAEKEGQEPRYPETLRPRLHTVQTLSPDQKGGGEHKGKTPTSTASLGI